MSNSPDRSKWLLPLRLLLVGLVAALASQAAWARQDPGVIAVKIDIKPGDEPTVMDPRSDGMVPVAVLSDDDFDATTVDPATVRFGASGDEATPVRTITEDIDGDGDTDRMFLFRAGQTEIKCGDTSATLTGKTRAGRAFAGSESFTMEGCGAGGHPMPPLSSPHAGAIRVGDAGDGHRLQAGPVAK